MFQYPRYQMLKLCNVSNALYNEDAEIQYNKQSDANYGIKGKDEETKERKVNLSL